MAINRIKQQCKEQDILITHSHFRFYLSSSGAIYIYIYIYIYMDILIFLPSDSNPYWSSREKLYLTAAEIRTRDLRFTSPTLYQPSYKAKSGAGRGMIVFHMIFQNTNFFHVCTARLYLCKASVCELIV